MSRDVKDKDVSKIEATSSLDAVYRAFNALMTGLQNDALKISDLIAIQSICFWCESEGEDGMYYYEKQVNGFFSGWMQCRTCGHKVML